MHQQIQRQHSYIQEQREALIQAQTELGTTINGKRQYEAHAQEEMQSAARNYQHLEAQAKTLYEHHEHQQHAHAMQEAQKQAQYIAAWEDTARRTEAHIMSKQQELLRVEKNLEMYADELYSKDMVQELAANLQEPAHTGTNDSVVILLPPPQPAAPIPKTRVPEQTSTGGSGSSTTDSDGIVDALVGVTSIAPPPAQHPQQGQSSGSNVQQKANIEVPDTPARPATAVPEPTLTGEIELEQPGTQTPSDARRREKDQLGVLTSQGYSTPRLTQDVIRSLPTLEPGELPRGDTDYELIAPTERADSPPQAVGPAVTPWPPAPPEEAPTPIADHTQASTNGSVTDLTQKVHLRGQDDGKGESFTS